MRRLTGVALARAQANARRSAEKARQNREDGTRARYCAHIHWDPVEGSGGLIDRCRDCGEERA